MKNVNLNNYGVQEMNAEEMIFQNGGGMAGPPASTYMTSAQMNAAGDAIRTGIGFVVGLLSAIF